MLKNQKGFSMMEAVVAAGLVGVITVSALTLWENYFKTDLGQARITELTKDLYVLRSFIEDSKACEINFKGKIIGTKLEEFKNSNNASVLKVGQTIGKEAYVLESIEIGEFDSKTGRTTINVLFKKTDSKGRSQSTYRKFFVLTKVKDNVIEECVDQIETSASGALAKFCADADPRLEWDCEKVLKNMAYELKEKYCGDHPILRFNAATGKCYAFDATKNCQAGYIRGYDSHGNLVCYLGPGKAEVPPKICTNWSPWGLDPLMVCKGEEFEQKRHCKDTGVSGTEFRKIFGTREGCGEAAL